MIREGLNSSVTEKSLDYIDGMAVMKEELHTWLRCRKEREM